MGCNFYGPIPTSMGSLQKLTHLFLNSNRFSGPIPHSIGNLASLIWLDLSSNQLDGALPVSNKTASGMDKLVMAEHFHLGNNKLSGEIPLGLFDSKMALRHLIFNHNQLNGTIPDTIGLVLSLEVIRLDRNLLSGSVPQNLNNLMYMKELYMANNNLSGPFPNLTGMNLLSYLDLSNNSFYAPAFPQWFTTLQTLTTLRMESTGLRGHIPIALFNLSQLQTVLLKNNKLNGKVHLGTDFSSDLQLIDLRNNYIDEFSLGEFKNTVLLDDNPYCMRPEAEGICKKTELSRFSNFVPKRHCVPLSCFLDPIQEPACKRPYLGILVFRSFNFSNLQNRIYYNFLTDSLKPLLTKIGVPIDKVCLVSSVMDTNGNLVLHISFFPADGVYFNRTGISTIGNIFNIHIFETPYGPYFFIDLTYRGFSVTEPRPAESGKKNSLVLGITISGCMLILLSVFAGVYAYRKRKIAEEATKLNHPFASWDQDDIPQLNGVICYSFEDVRKFTNNFSNENEIGVGGYGKVFKGRLDCGQLVAVKIAKQGSTQGALEFKTEIELLSRVHHKNVVDLVGFCYDEGEQMLIYEYALNGSLREILSGKSGVYLNWTRRVQVALGAARGLAYLHELANPPIIHRDIKSSNILMDSHLNAKVADFGLCKPLSDDSDCITTEVKGTMGYMDPEYYMTWQLTGKSDVYSFGVVMLELVTGKLPVEDTKYIVTEVERSMNATGDIYNLIDPTIRCDNLMGLWAFVNLAMRCVQYRRSKRPTMGEVVKVIEDIVQATNLNPIGGSTSTSTSYEITENDLYPSRVQQQRLLQSP